MKRFLSILFIFFSTITCIAQGFTYNYRGVEFKGKISNGTACIKSFNNKAQIVTIPSTITHKGINYPVKSVSVFMNGVNYTTVDLTIEEGIEDIDKYCFNEFRKLQVVNLPTSLRHIGKNAFRNNVGMKLNMLSSIDENSLRNGIELYPNGNGSITTYESSAASMARAKSAAKSSAKKASGLLSSGLFGVAKSTNKNQPTENNRHTSDKPVSTTVSSQPVKTTPEKVEHSTHIVDVDIDIPVVNTNRNNNTYCIIIANEKYADVPEVEFAERDGNIFREYCLKTLAIPEKQVRTYINASYTDIKRALNWVETMANISDGNSKVLVYYAGHGIPSEKDQTAYLIPTDGFPKDITTCFKLSDLYSRLGKLKTERVTVLLDACFSGVKRGTGQTLISARGVAIRPKSETLTGNMVVFTAASDDETALSYQEKHHGMFTYFLLDKLKKTRGEASLSEIFKSISSDVMKNSMLENDKLQTPSVNISSNLSQKWENMKL